MAFPVVATVDDALDPTSIVKVLVSFVKISYSPSKVAADNPPTVADVLEITTKSPRLAPWPDFVIVTVDDPSVVVKQFVALTVDLIGVTSKNCPSEYTYNFLSVPRASYFVPVNDVHANCSRTDPIIAVEDNLDQPPIFSGWPYQNLTMSESFHMPSEARSESCLLIPGLKLNFVSGI